MNRFEKDMKLVNMCHEKVNNYLHSPLKNELPFKTKRLRCEYYMEVVDRTLREWDKEFSDKLKSLFLKTAEAENEK